MARVSRWRTIVATAIVIYGSAVIFAVVSMYWGIYDVAATTPHWPLTTWVLSTVRTRSIETHAVGIRAPAKFDDESRIITGVGHYAAHCAVCHGAPGVPKGEIAEGMYPKPPDLAAAARAYTPAELFWIVKNGIKMTGMPSWSDHSDNELWATVAFLQKLPGMSDAEYVKLLQAGMAQGGHRHEGH